MADVKLSGTVESNTKFLQLVTLPFANITAGNIEKDFKREYPSSDISLIYFDTHTVTMSGTILDCQALTDQLTNMPVSFTKIEHIVIENKASNPVQIGGISNSIFLDPLPDLSLGCYSLTNVISVTAMGNVLDMITLIGSAEVDVLIVGS